MTAGEPGSLVGAVLPCADRTRGPRTCPHLLPAIAACVIFLGAYVLIATERWATRTAAALGGAALVLALGISDAHAAFFSEETGVDWNVIFLLLGMMIIVSVMRETGVFEYLAIWAAKRARGRPFPLMVLLILITAVASALLDNVTTVLLIAPVTILICQRLALPVVPYLIAEVFASNIGGTATLVGDPPNIIIASRGGLTFNDFLHPPRSGRRRPDRRPDRAVPMAVRRRLPQPTTSGSSEIMALNEREAIKDPACWCSRWWCSASCWSRSCSARCSATSRRWWRCSEPGC